MINTVEVWLWNTRIGILNRRSGREAVSFEYDRDFLRSGIELAPFKMPLSDRVFYFPELSQVSFHGLPGMIADSLPDKFGNAVIDKWLAAQGRPAGSFTALERLCYTGKRGMGALEYVPATGPALNSDSIDVSEMAKFASEILTDRTNAAVKEKEMHLAQMMEIGSSAGGARAKAVICWNRDTGEVKSGQIDAGEGYGYYLIKFDGVSGNGDHELADPKQYTLIEYAYYKMACDLGIIMKPCGIYEKDGLKHFLTERFDREKGTKIHMQTFAALSHSDFNAPGNSSYEMYADHARRMGIGQSGIEQIYKRMTLNAVGMNCDDHVKNFSFLMDKRGEWSLAPAYDITYAYAPGNRWLSGHQMSINGKTFGLTDDDIIQSGKNMGLGSGFCKRTLSETKSVIGKWMEYADSCGISEERAAEVERGIVLAGFVEAKMSKGAQP